MSSMVIRMSERSLGVTDQPQMADILGNMELTKGSRGTDIPGVSAAASASPGVHHILI